MKMNIQDHVFLTATDLPFNRNHLNSEFELLRPDRDPGGEGYWLLLQGMNVLLEEQGSELMMPYGANPMAVAGGSPGLYVGQWRGKPCRVISVEQAAPLAAELRAAHLRAPDQPLSLALLSLAGMGQMILHWDAESRYCGNCGGQMVYLPGEWGKECRSCGARHFPRIHPCVIGLVVKGDEILLARKGEWTDGRYGLVAGFVDFSECLEEAMAREVMEETNIQITNIRYIGSQSWPFPSQLMCGFVADYAGGEIQLNDHELAAAGWFKINDLPTIPPKRSIARYLIDCAEDFIAHG